MMLENPYGAGESWLRGNLHAHTTRSDGRREPQEVIDDYAARGYDFLMISDHDGLTPPDEFEARGMVLIPGNEVTARGPHLLHVAAAETLKPVTNRQQVIDAIRKDRRSFAVMAHPNWHPDFNHLPQADLARLDGYIGIEIYNGVIERLSGSPFATDRWDQLLGQGRRVWGFANDDSHYVDDVELGWNVVQTADRSPAGIVEAMRRGAFYASTGVGLESIRVEGRVISITAREQVRWAVYREFQKRIGNEIGTQLEFEVPEDPKLKYVRIEAHGALGRVAWTQPFYASP